MINVFDELDQYLTAWKQRAIQAEQQVQQLQEQKAALVKRVAELEKAGSHVDADLQKAAG